MGDTPRTSESIRYRALRGKLVVNARHENVQLNDWDRLLLQRLNGDTRVATLTDEMAERVARNELSIEDVSNPTAADISAAVERSLHQFARASLLYAESTE